MIEELIGRIFATRNAAHLAHWRTSSYAQHQALGAFYDDLVGKIDAIVEMYQGAFDVIDKVPTMQAPANNILTHLNAEVEWIETNLDELSGGIKAIENALQDLSASYYTTIYKLTHLQ